MIARIGGDKGADWKSFVENTLKEKNLPPAYLGSPENLPAVSKSLFTSPSIVPVCAVFGGQLGQEVLKMLTTKGECAWNFLTFDGESQVAREVRVGPKEE